MATIPYVGKWNCADNKITTGQTTFQPGTGLPLHTHNCEESVLILEGEAVAQIDDETFDLEVGPGDLGTGRRTAPFLQPR